MKIKHLLILVGLAVAFLGTRAMAQVTSATTSGIVGSVHDFTTVKGGTNNFGWNTASESTCQVCHTPHNADTSGTTATPLWVHATTSQTYQLYADPNPTGGEMSLAGITPGQPSGVSLACLSCHDGTVAINQSIGGAFSGSQHGETPAAYKGPYLGQIGSYLVVTGGTGSPTLAGTHPISISYPGGPMVGTFIRATTTPLNTVAQLNLGVNNTDIWPGATTSPTISNLLYNGKVECSSCHDVHAQIGDAPGDHYLLKIGLQDFDSSGRGDTLCRTCHIK